MKYVVIALILLTVGFVSWQLIISRPQPAVLGVTSSYTNTQNHNFNLSDPDSFLAAINDQYSFQQDKPIKGLIIPHHLLARQFMADGIYQLTQHPPKTIILLVPNHHEAGEANIISSNTSWSSPLGTTHPNTALIGQLMTKDLVSIDDSAILGEQSLTDVIPFISHFLPNTTLVPLVVSNTMSLDKALEFSDEITTILADENIALILSADFSHYLLSQQADEKDETTLQAIVDRNYAKIFSFGNDHTDSPVALSIFLNTLDDANYSQMLLWNKSNSAKIIEDYSVPTTSYFEMGFIPDEY